MTLRCASILGVVTCSTKITWDRDECKLQRVLPTTLDLSPEARVAIEGRGDCETKIQSGHNAKTHHIMSQTARTMFSC